MPARSLQNPGSQFVFKSIQKDGTYSVEHESPNAKYPEYLPTWDTKEWYEPLEFYEHQDPGKRADPNYPNLFPEGAKFTRKNITPNLGVEIDGVQLSQLSDAGKDELSLLVAKQGLAVFRNQDWAFHGPKYITEYGRYFGPLHIHPVSGSPKGVPEIHVVYRRGSSDSPVFNDRNSYISFHLDVSYELQPPGTTFFAMLEGPESGNDTLFADMVEAYNRLSPAFKERLEGLKVLHTSRDQAISAKNRGGIQKRDPVSNIHPLVRVIPSTGEKALYVNPQFSERIIGLKEEESNYLLEFLFQHFASAHDLQARASYEPGTVVVWDNRRVTHSAIIDTSEFRHCVRVTPTFERVIDNLKDLNKPDVNGFFPKEQL